MNLEEKEKIINDVINVIDDTDSSDYHLSDYQRKIIEDIAKKVDPIVVIGRKNEKSWLSILIWAKDMYIMIHGVTPTYDELVEFTTKVLTDGHKVETETRILSFSIGIPKERTIVDIKKDIKHEKNPMRLKQLNKELNKLYKENKRKKEEDEHH